jgi:hypothetical protein
VQVQTNHLKRSHPNAWDPGEQRREVGTRCEMLLVSRFPNTEGPGCFVIAAGTGRNWLSILFPGGEDPVDGGADSVSGVSAVGTCHEQVVVAGVLVPD